MAYKKYIKRGGKIYGPYIYHSRRVDGKVVSEYHGPTKFNYKKFLWAIPVLIILVLGVYFISQQETSLTGYSVLDLNANYQQGQPLEGNLRLSLQEGEFIPASSKIIFENNGNIFEYNLRDLVSAEPTQGDFYVKGVPISGTGEGFGIPGEKEAFPEVSFVLSILSNQSAESVNESQEVVDETNETSGLGEIISNFFLGLGPTGNVIVEFENEIKGRVSAGESFTYTLQPGQRAELKPRSVMAGTTQLNDGDVEIRTEGNEVIVTTNYSDAESGFGIDYLGEGSEEINIDVSSLGMVLEEGNLRVSFVDSGQEIVSMTTILVGGEVSTTSPPIIPSETTSEVPVSTNQTNKTKINVTIPVAELTSEERAILYAEFGNFSVEQNAKLRNEFIIVRYELKNYWVENAYDAALDNETLQSFMQQDKIKLLKDIAKKLSEEEKPEVELPELSNSSEI